jgi:alpha-L-fucosidase
MLGAASAARLNAAPAGYKPTHDSLIGYGVPQWYQDAKFGIYMHWAPFSVPAYETEWYPRWMYVEGSDIQQHHIKTWGPLNKFGYKDFIPMFKAEKFDPEAYVRLFKEAGARYVASAAVHHDGFAMWDSKYIPFNAKVMGPKRDIVNDIVTAARKAGLKTGVSTHYGRHWLYYTFRPEYDTWDPKYEGLYGKRRGDDDPPRPEDAQHWKNVMTELIDKYKPDYIFVDGGVIDAQVKFKKFLFKDALYEVVAHYYNRSREWNKGVVITYKRAIMQPDEAVEDFERAGEDKIRKTKWQSDDKVSITGWCYVKDTGFWPVDLLIGNFLDIVSKNGNLLLSIGPKPDGTIREEEVQALKEIGAWLKVNGEAIYGSTPWRVFGEGKEIPFSAPGYKPPRNKPKMRMGPDSVRFTSKGGAVYATVFDWPRDGRFLIKSITGQPIKSVSMLGSAETLRWNSTAQGLEVRFPNKKPCSHAYVFKIVP